jgi:threonine synthase
LLHVSTRGEAPAVGFTDALLAGLARDGGLYLPQAWPVLPPDVIAGFAGRRYADVAKTVMGALIDGDIPSPDLDRMVEEAYAGFRHPAVCPLVQIGDNLFVLELFHGPTLAFKDLAMQLLGRLMDHVLKARGTRATIVGATSGDTGSAAVEAFRGLDQVDVFIL